jgi:hypothetical protein
VLSRRARALWFSILVGALCLSLPQIGLAAAILGSPTGSQGQSRPEFSLVAGTDDVSSSWALGMDAELPMALVFIPTGTPKSVDPYLAGWVLPTDLDGHPDETPPSNKVPEPASLMLVGTAFLGVARASRMNWPRRKFTGSQPRQSAVPFPANPGNSIVDRSAAA